ncbi:ABC transporter substrate-binding protein [Demetria terragena]|uniref:ABC transporter substrate-binding protein n=1 Tax=Demetria terragena TaxID=63959 RepID=UPI0003615DCE|nr:ABC transporter substrate-binding protein [Demetria terragena]
MILARRSLLLGGSALSLAALSACRATEENSGSATGNTSAQPTAGDEFPVTIAHKFGETTITKRPERIVLVGLVEQDMLLALGIVPVAVTEWLMGAKDEIYPWARPLLNGKPAPVVLSTADGIQIGKIAGLKPDLILGNYAGVTSAEYAKLSKIAPTVAQPKEFLDYGVSWDANALIVAKAVGQSAKGKKIVADTRKQIKDAAAAHPEFKGKSCAVTSAYEGIYIYGPQDPRTRLMSDLGFVFPDKFKDIGGGKEFGGSISAERTREVDFQAAVWVSSEAEVNKATGGLWKQTEASKKGRAVYIPYATKQGELTTTYSVAFSFLTPLSIPYLLKSLVPQLAAAVDSDPATKVPGPKPYSA